MGEKHKILSVGGDMRSVFCAARLATEYDTSILGFDAEDIPHGSGLHICDASKKKKETILRQYAMQYRYLAEDSHFLAKPEMQAAG